MQTPTLQTERLTLRLGQLSDAQDIFDTWTSDPDVAKFMRWNTHTSVDETTEYLIQTINNASSSQHFDWIFVLKETGKPMGSGGIFWNEKHNMFELGYGVAKKYWGQGFATEAAVAILEFAKRERGAKEFFACHAKENSASGRILEKLGFVYHSDGTYSTFDGKTTFEMRRFFLK